jgi:uncharacterized protein (TIRG00374 family)
MKSILFKVLSAGFTGALIVLVLLWFRNNVKEYGDALSATITSLTPLETGYVIAAAFGIMTLSAMAMRTPLNGISTGKAFICQQGSSAVSNVIPGPSGTAMRFAMLHSWGVGVEDFTRGTVAVSIWNNVAMISMPGIAFLVLAFSGDSTYDSSRLVVLSLVAVVVSVVALALVAGVLRSEALARWLGKVTAIVANPVLRLFRKPRRDDLPEQAAELRQRTVDVVHARKARLTAITLGSYWLNGLLLVTCMWFAGVPVSALPLVVGLALYSIGRIGTIIQITPGGVGVVEVVYAAVYMTVVPAEYDSNVVAGILLYRLLTYVGPILVGAVCYLIWRWIRRGEIKAEQDEVAAPAGA